MNPIDFKVTDFVKKVTANLSKTLIKSELDNLQHLLNEMGIEHLDGFALMSLYLPPNEKQSEKIKEFISEPSNLISHLNVTHSWLFNKLEDYSRSITEIDSLNIFKERLKILIKALKVLGFTFIDETELLNLTPIEKKKIFKSFHNEIINFLYTHSQDIDLDTVKELFNRLSKPLGSSRITKDIAPVAKSIEFIKIEESERINNQLINQLSILNLIPDNGYNRQNSCTF